MGTDKFVGFLNKIPDIGLPEKFQLKNLKSLGYTSSNDERFIPALRFIGFIDTSGTPSSLWKEARGALGPAVAKGVRSGYAELFSQYNNAHQKDDEALRTFFSVHTGTGKDAVSKMVATFKALCSIANFETSHKTSSSEASEVQVNNGGQVTRGAKAPLHEEVNGSTIPVSLNIQLQLPPDPTGEIYEKFFAAMVKHFSVRR